LRQERNAGPPAERCPAQQGDPVQVSACGRPANLVMGSSRSVPKRLLLPRMT